MSAYPPPTENVPIFNPVYYTSPVATSTINNLARYFLEFPIAQGTEYFTNASFSQFPTCSATALPSNTNNTQLATTAFVQSVASTISGLQTLVISSQPSNPYILTQIYNWVVIGVTPGTVFTSTTIYLPYLNSGGIPAGTQTIIRNNTTVSQTISINSNYYTFQYIVGNSSNTQQNTITLNAGGSVTLVFQGAGNTSIGVWYVIGV